MNNYDNYDNENYNNYNDQNYGNYDNGEYSQPFNQITDKQAKIASNIFGCVGWLFTAPFLIAGIFLLVFGAKNFFTIGSDKKACTEMVTGTVIKIQSWNDTNPESRNEDSSDTYAPVFEYEYQGNTYTEKGRFFSSSAGFAVGDSVDIYVDPHDPKHVYIPSYKQKKSGSGMAMVCGAICLAVGLAVPLTLKRRTKKALTTSIPDQYY